MKQYLLSVYQPDGDPPPPEFLEPVMRSVRALTEELQAAGMWVFHAGLHPASTATVVHLRDGLRDNRRAVQRRERAHWRLHDHQGAGSRRRASLGQGVCEGDHAARSRSVRCRERLRRVAELAAARVLPAEQPHVVLARKPLGRGSGCAPRGAPRSAVTHAAANSATSCQELITGVTTLTTSEIERVFRDEYGRAVAVLVASPLCGRLTRSAPRDPALPARQPTAGMHTPSSAGFSSTTAAASRS